MFLEIGSNRLAVFFKSKKPRIFYKEASVMKSLFRKAVSSHTSKCTQKDVITGVFQ